MANCEGRFKPVDVKVEGGIAWVGVVTLKCSRRGNAMD